MSRVLYPFNFVPNGQILDNFTPSYQPCFASLPENWITGTATLRPIGLKLIDAMRLAWIVRSFKMNFPSFPEHEFFIYENNILSGGPFPPPDDEKFLPCCGFSLPSKNPNKWGRTHVAFGNISLSVPGSYSVSILLFPAAQWYATGYPETEEQKKNFDPVEDLTIWPQFNIQGAKVLNVFPVEGLAGGSVVGSPSQTIPPDLSGYAKATTIFLPKSAGFTMDYNLDFYNVFSSRYNVVAPTFTFNNFWEYRDENGQNPIWDKETGARL
jgi:hypothetical protein